MLRRLSENMRFSKKNLVETSETGSISATFSDACEGEDTELLQVQIKCQKTLNQFWKELQQGAHQHTKSIHITLSQTDPLLNVSKLRHLQDVFGTIGSLPQLEEVVFSNSNLLASLLPKLSKKKSSSLQSLKFHNCTFIAKKLEHVQDKLWNQLILLQKDNLVLLEIRNCSYTASENLCRNRIPFVHHLPLSLPNELPSLQRLVLDECILDNRNDEQEDKLVEQEAFLNLLNDNTSLVELEIRPVFPAKAFQTKEQVLRTFLTETIPISLLDNHTLKKLVVSLEDCHLEQVYVDVMNGWVEMAKSSSCPAMHCEGTAWKTTSRNPAPNKPRSTQCLETITGGSAAVEKSKQDNKAVRRRVTFIETSGISDCATKSTVHPKRHSAPALSRNSKRRSALPEGILSELLQASFTDSDHDSSVVIHPSWSSWMTAPSDMIEAKGISTGPETPLE